MHKRAGQRRFLERRSVDITAHITSSREKVSDALEGKPRFCGTSDLSFEHMVQGELSVQGVEEVKAIHTNNALGATEGG
ncbi:hypothetical protein [Burkholderia multivorans]|uniref:hypothetical protein n=1 Tax=Burkholderia multivorans TaxID=87883 RepID=UPI0005BC7F70|nr:hypothetical protein [Burkholderia multivorans]MBJ9658171.1 hypothetical protein [Burkholderia multivorans]MBU9284170.1 hypothetical protein [Burkholderia multivorans]MBU9436158.1 hypothetical protein [Burkholderia multivorans]MBU9474980.1 hypothetical protein [Burkholderia multivorans]